MTIGNHEKLAYKLGEKWIKDFCRCEAISIPGLIEKLIGNKGTRWGAVRALLGKCISGITDFLMVVFTSHFWNVSASLMGINEQITGKKVWPWTWWLDRPMREPTYSQDDDLKMSAKRAWAVKDRLRIGTEMIKAVNLNRTRILLMQKTELGSAEDTAIVIWAWLRTFRKCDSCMSNNTMEEFYSEPLIRSFASPREFEMVFWEGLQSGIRRAKMTLGPAAWKNPDKNGKVIQADESEVETQDINLAAGSSGLTN